jgi:cation diffusion facilitator CzcD-associated flavoprotein CzcO
VAKLVRRVLPARPAAWFLRWFNALATQGLYRVSKRRPQLVKKVMRKGLERELPKDFDIDTHFTPRYDPWDQRVCAVADGDLFRQIRNGKVDIVTDTVDRFTETGIRLGSGVEIPADVIVPATGLELLFLGGVEMAVDGEKVSPPEKLTYKGMMLEGVPNFAFTVGYTNASWTLKADLSAEYVCRLLTALRDRGLRQCTPHNDEPSVSAGPLLALNSGYIQRAIDRVPQQGTRFPWQVYESYLKDYRAMKLSKVDDEAMAFTNPG